MRKFCWQRWTLMFLLVTRMVIGELGHAMPIAMGPAEQAVSVVGSDPSACAEHERGADERPAAHHTDSGGDHTSHSSGQRDCCKSGDCECPCLHAPCAAFDALILDPIATASLGTSHGMGGVISRRPDGLFRPPA